MKAILEFNLPEDNHDYELHTHATKMSICIHDFINLLHRYRDDDTLGYGTVERISKDFNELLEDNEISHLF